VRVEQVVAHRYRLAGGERGGGAGRLGSRRRPSPPARARAGRPCCPASDAARRPPHLCGPRPADCGGRQPASIGNRSPAGDRWSVPGHRQPGHAARPAAVPAGSLLPGEVRDPTAGDPAQLPDLDAAQLPRADQVTDLDPAHVQEPRGLPHPQEVLAAGIAVPARGGWSGRRAQQPGQHPWSPRMRMSAFSVTRTSPGPALPAVTLTVTEPPGNQQTAACRTMPSGAAYGSRQLPEGADVPEPASASRPRPAASRAPSSESAAGRGPHPA
jgi:hypothetical protein